MLHKSAIEILKAYLSVRSCFFAKNEPYSPYLFPSSKAGKHLTRQRAGQILKELALEAGLDPDVISPHKLRHSFATHMLHNGADIRSMQVLLGHAHINTTQIYTKVKEDHKKEILWKFHPLAPK